MPVFLLGLLKSKYTWYALLAVALVIGFVGLRAHYRSEGKASGVVEQKQSEASDIESLRKTAEGQLNAVVASAQAQIAEANQRANVAAQQAQQQGAMIIALASQRSAATQVVAQVKDSDLHAYNVTTLAVRAPSDQTPGYTYPEERAISNVLTQFPLMQKQIDASAKEVDSLKVQVAAVLDANNGLVANLTAEQNYTEQLMGYYTTLWNNQAKNHRGLKCLGLWNCAKTTLPTPAPTKVKQ